MNVADELLKLQQLRESGAIDDEEYATAKARVLSGQPAKFLNLDLGNVDQQTKFWGMLLHLSILAGYMVPIAGLVLPIVIWQLKKDELPEIDVHGKNATNWIISHIIYFAVCVVLIFAIIGFPLMFALGLVSIIFPIVAAIKANKGEVWQYPMAIAFFK